MSVEGTQEKFPCWVLWLDAKDFPDKYEHLSAAGPMTPISKRGKCELGELMRRREKRQHVRLDPRIIYFHLKIGCIGFYEHQPYAKDLTHIISFNLHIRVNRSGFYPILQGKKK